MKILVAEDDYSNRIFLFRLLQKNGHEVTEVTDGQQALDELRRQPYDLVLMDVLMPVLNGVELTRLIRARTYPEIDPELPIIAVTGLAMQGDRELFLTAGMSWYLSKPLDAGDLFEILSTLEQDRVYPRNN